jgi:hypothetical protein
LGGAAADNSFDHDDVDEIADEIESFSGAANQARASQSSLDLQINQVR